ncbi:MAG: leucine-rich repeat domain-containing protein [Clostridia bacterium]|nr:leucine-rich repeat domain-containing protein [Clostridia bacterium]
MKKFLFMFAALVLCIALFTACGSEKTDAKEPERDSAGLEYTLLPDGTYSVSGGSLNSDGIELVIPAEFNGKPVTAVEDFGFRGLWMESVNLPDSIKEIGIGAFSFCPELRSAELPAGLTVIRENAFRGCEDLKEVKLPDSVRLVEKGAFRGCRGLRNLYMPAGLEEIRSGAFADCADIDAVHIGDVAAWCGVKFADASANPLSGADRLYVDGKAVSVLWIGEGVETISPYAFAGCGGIDGVVIPSTLKTVGERAFDGCDGLTQKFWSGTREELNRLEIRDHNGPLAAAILYLYSEERPEKYGLYWYEKDGEVCVWGSVNYVMSPSADSYSVANGVGAEIIIADEYGHMPVKTIMEGAMKEHAELIFVSVGRNVTVIGAKAFYGCNNLREIVLPAGLTEVGNDAFLGCTMLNTVYFCGTQEEWELLVIASGNNNLKKSEIYFYSENEPTDPGFWWHYGEDGRPIVWDN